MKIVKLTFNYDWPIFRQTSGFSQIWGDYKFVIDENLKECDFWIVYSDYKLIAEQVKCNPENIIFIPGECYHTSPKFSQRFLNQFGLIVTMQKELKHSNILYAHNANPWFIGKTYDELKTAAIPVKTKLISVITSNKSHTEGHKKRIDFVKKLKEHFGDQLALFGRGINDFEDKWDVLADYKYSIAIENDFCEDWVTEKLFDCIYANALPFYYGCPNLERYVNPETFISIDIDDFEKSVAIIETAISNNEYEKRAKLLDTEKQLSLDRDQFFPFVVNILEKMNSNSVKKIVKLRLNQDQNFTQILKGLAWRIKKRILKNIQ
ncbi:MAG: glycosyltransferase family 10 [Flavobacterium sp.]|nr:glycosyltransferase family 10 [Flavobacterium sp.]